MVCLGNICRSPLADGVLRHKVRIENLSVEVDSAGTSNYHVGEAPDKRMIQTAKSKGIDISFLRARQFTSNDFLNFDRIYVMDDSNYENVLALAPSESHRSKVAYLLAEIDGRNNSVPDPYFGKQDGFEHVFNLINAATDVIINQLKSNTSS